MNQQIISFSQFIDYALYAPNTGYYTREKISIGAEGDFTTAPESSSLFSQAVAKQIAQVLKAVQKPIILELGAGSGKFAIECLKQLERENQLPEVYWILERSVVLQGLQKENIQQAIPHLANRVVHLSALPDKHFAGVIFANEVLDALVFDCFEKQDGKILERAVSNVDGQCHWILREPGDKLLSAIESIESEVGELPDGYQSEVCLQTDSWLKSITEQLTQGLVLLIDYGYEQSNYYRSDRLSGTLMCYHQHKGHDDPFINVGEQDITAHVDFTRVANAAFDSELDILGFTYQMQFLAMCGIESLANEISDPLQRRNELMRIMHPAQMGEVFKVMALGRAIDFDLIGFAGVDLIDRL